MIFLIFFTETICCDPSSGDGSDERSQPRFLCRTDKNYPSSSPNTSSYLELYDVDFFSEYVCQVMQTIMDIIAYFA